MENMPIRVLQILGQVNNGGVEAVVMNYYRHIDKSKVQFDFVMHRGSNQQYIAEIQSLGAKVYQISPYNKNIIAFTYDIYKIIKEGHYNIVHSNMNALSVFPLFAAWLAGAKVRILHNHTTDTNAEGLRTLIKRILRPFAKVFANQYWACSKLAAEWMYGKQALNAGKVTIINNAIDLCKFAFNQEKRNVLREELRLEGKFVVGHVGRFMKQKNHDFLIDVFAEIARLRADSVLILIGEGPLLTDVKEKVRQFKLEQQVKFLGVRNDVADLYNVMDVFVLPSLYEGLPVVGVEVQANGLPFICSKNITNEVIINKNVKSISLNEPIDKWTSEIISVLSNDRRSVREKLMDKFDINTASRRLESYYTSLDKKLTKSR